MTFVRDPQSIYQVETQLVNGSFNGRWHFVFGDYYDQQYEDFGTLRVFNDHTFTPGAVWPLHHYRNYEIVTYIVDGEFRHEDEHGTGSVLMKGWVQHTTAGSGLWHTKINNRVDRPLRFIQMWFYPALGDLAPSVEQKTFEMADMTDFFLPLVSNRDKDTLPIASDARVHSGFLQPGKTTRYYLGAGRGIYLYVLKGGPIYVNEAGVPEYGAAMITEEKRIDVTPLRDAELLLVDIKL
jgi:quercetin 2,3-dioxygenase